MLRSLHQIYGTKLEASDGAIGQLKDFYFNDQDWVIRYAVADTGLWLKSRSILLSPYAFARLRNAEKVLRVKPTRKQIENSPLFDSPRHISRRFEEEYHRYHGWPCYWQGGAMWGTKDVPVIKVGLKHLPEDLVQPAGQPVGPNSRLYSTLAVAGYEIFDASGPMGLVSDFLMDGDTWAIRELVVRIGHRLSGAEIRIPTSKIIRISHEESAVLVKPPNQPLVNCPAKEAALAVATD